MPAPPGPHLINNLHLARQLLADPRQPIAAYTRRYGPVWQSLIPAGGSARLVPLVWIMGREGNERILAPQYKDDFSWYEGYRFTMEPLFGRRILFLLDDDQASAKGDEHRQRLRLLVPAFHPRLDEDYCNIIQRIVKEHLDRLAIDTNRPVDIQDVIKRFTFHAVARLLVGAAAHELAELTELFEELGRGLYSVIHLPLPGLPFSRARRASDRLRRYLSNKLAACRRGEEAPPPMLAGLLSAASQAPSLISDDSIIAELIAFLYAGYDTTGSLLTSLIVALTAKENQPALGRLVGSLRGSFVYPKAEKVEKAGEPTDGAYLDAVITEGERLFPPLLFALRGVRRDIQYAGYDIKAGSKVTYSPYYTGRQPELFSDPLVFRPERFLQEDGSYRRPLPYTVLGFGGGHRMCIGKRLALLEMRLFLRNLFQRFDLTVAADAKEVLYFNPALQRKNGYPVYLNPVSSSRIPTARSTDQPHPGVLGP